MRDIIQMFTTGKKWTMSKEHGLNDSHCLITITPIIILTFKTILFISNKLNSIYTVVEETPQFGMSHLGRGHRGLWTHRNVVGEPKMLKNISLFLQGKECETHFLFRRLKLVLTFSLVTFAMCLTGEFSESDYFPKPS